LNLITPALGTIAVIAGMINILEFITMLTAIDLSSQGGCAAVFNILKSLSMRGYWESP
jgi:hypothetical protein